MFRRTPSRGSRGRRAAVDFVVFFRCGGILWGSFLFFSFERTRPAASTRPSCLIYLSTIVLIARAAPGSFPQIRYLWRRVSANAWDVFRRTPSQRDRGRRAAVDFVVCSGYGGISCFFVVFFFEHTRPAASMRPPCLMYLSTTVILYLTGSMHVFESLSSFN